MTQSSHKAVICVPQFLTYKFSRRTIVTVCCCPSSYLAGVLQIKFISPSSRNSKFFIIPELYWTKSPTTKVEDKSTLGHAHGVKVAAVVVVAGAAPGEEDEARVVAGPKGEPDARVAADAMGVDLEEAAAIEAHCLDGLERLVKGDVR